MSNTKAWSEYLTFRPSSCYGLWLTARVVMSANTVPPTHVQGLRLRFQGSDMMWQELGHVPSFCLGIVHSVPHQKELVLGLWGPSSTGLDWQTLRLKVAYSLGHGI